MDLQYLFLLQQLRAMLGGCLDEIFNGLSKVAVVVMPLLPVAIYWCVSKKWGYRFLATIWCGEVVNGLVKLTVCAYRPWIRAAGLEPAGDSKVAATGYSFPSGHTMCATATYGTLPVWQYKKRRWIAVTR
jgi:membrane-associated phospholipid phosphatase